MKEGEQMTGKDQLADDQCNSRLTDFGAQMTVPFYALSNIFLNAVNLQTDVVRLMNKEPKSKNEKFPLDTSKLSPRVYSILQQKAQANELEDYIMKLVEQDLVEKEDKTVNLIDALREEVFSEISILKQELASRPVVDAANHAHDLRNLVTKLDEQELNKKEFHTLLNSLRSEFLDQIKLLKNEFSLRPAVPAQPAKELPEKVNDLKEGQLLESDQITGTIKEVIDVDF
jgi:DNA-binding Lrp family transcriptional regulator